MQEQLQKLTILRFCDILNMDICLISETGIRKKTAEMDAEGDKSMKLLIDSVFRKLKAESPEERKALIRQFIKFGLVGLSNTLVAWAVYYLVLWLNPDLYMVGSIAGTVISIANAFFWNDRFVFKGAQKDRKSKLKRLGKTYVSYGGTSILATVLLWAEVRFLGVGKVFAPVLNLLITIPLNFLINKFWTFHK